MNDIDFHLAEDGGGELCVWVDGDPPRVVAARYDTPPILWTLAKLLAEDSDLGAQLRDRIAAAALEEVAE